MKSRWKGVERWRTVASRSPDRLQKGNAAAFSGQKEVRDMEKWCGKVSEGIWTHGLVCDCR